MEDTEIRIKIELEEIERNMQLLFDLLSEGKITDGDYRKLSAYPYRRRSELNSRLEEMKRN